MAPRLGASVSAGLLHRCWGRHTGGHRDPPAEGPSSGTLFDAICQGPASSGQVSGNLVLPARGQNQFRRRPFDWIAPRRRGPRGRTPDLARQGEVRSERTRFGGQTLTTKGLLQPVGQVQQLGAGTRGSAPQHPGAGEVADPVDSHVHRTGRQCVRRPLGSGQGVGIERAQESQGQVQVQRMGGARAARDESGCCARQGLAGLGVRPQGEEPALALRVGSRAQARISTSRSRARRTL